MEITVAQALLSLIGGIIILFLGVLVNLVRGVRTDFKEFVKEQRAYNERLVALESEVRYGKAV